MAEAPNKADTSTTHRSNLSNYLSIDKKPRLKWEGSSQQLESFVKETLSLTGKWSSHFTSDEISITFHINTIHKHFKFKAKKAMNSKHAC
jgi:hypothetical protein